MKVIINGLILALLFSLCLWGCASSPPLTQEQITLERTELDKFIVKFRGELSRGDATAVYQLLSQDSKDWIDNIRVAANSEPLNFLINRPFFEILAILALRVQRRINPGIKEDPVSILKQTIISVAPIKNNFVKNSLGPFHVLDYETAEVGLEKTPNVPVYFFKKEQDGWKINLVNSLPLILLGAENLARQQKSETIAQAAWVIENFMGQKLQAEDFR